jgi:hypothetical protein
MRHLFVATILQGQGAILIKSLDDILFGIDRRREEGGKEILA